MYALLEFALQIPALQEEICQLPGDYYGNICLPKLQQLGGILKIPRAMDGSVLSINYSGQKMGPTSTCSSI